MWFITPKNQMLCSHEIKNFWIERQDHDVWTVFAKDIDECTWIIGEYDEEFVAQIFLLSLYNKFTEKFSLE